MDFSDIPSDIAHGTPCATGVFHFGKTLDPSDHLHYWVADNNPALLQQAVDHFAAKGYDSHYYITYNSRDHYIAHHGHRAPLQAKFILNTSPAAAAPTADLITPPTTTPLRPAAPSAAAAASPAAMVSPPRPSISVHGGAQTFPPPPPPPPPKGGNHGVNLSVTATAPSGAPAPPFPPPSPVLHQRGASYQQQQQPQYQPPPPPQQQQQYLHTQQHQQFQQQLPQYQQHQQQFQTPPPPDFLNMFTMMMAQNSQLIQQIGSSQQSLATAATLKGPTIPFPKWESDTPQKFPVYAELIRAYKADPFFTTVTDWTTTTPTTEQQSSRIHRDMLTTIPSTYTSTYLHNPAFLSPSGGGLGIEMLQHFLEVMEPSRPENRLHHLQALTKIEFEAQDNLSLFWSRIREHCLALGAMTVAEAAPLLGLAALATSNPNCEGLVTRYYSGDPVVTVADIATMERLSKEEEQRRLLTTGATMAITPASNRTTSGTAPSTTPPRSTNTDQPPSQQVAFPPTKGIRWGTLKEVYNTKQCCPHCYSRDSFHWEVGCPFLATLGLVTVSDSAKSTDITTKYAAHTGRPNSSTPSPRRRNNNNNQRRNNRSANAATANPQPDDSPAPTNPPGADAASGCRASSSERPPTASNRTMYPDSGYLSSDDDDYFELGVTGTGQDSSSAGNSNNTTSALYPLSTISANHSTHLTSTRHHFPSISTELSTAAAKALTRSPNCVFSPDYNESSEDCCADSGATHMMLPDYKAFNSYRPQTNRTVKLGDKSTLQIAGEGTATFSLNGKIITVRNALHVPDLRQPLYSLRKHKSMPGCGTFSHNDVGSYILFPDFVLRIDDSTDNIVTYKSIGRQGHHRSSDYIEPRHTAANTTTTFTTNLANIIPPDDDSPVSTQSDVPSSPSSDSVIIPDDELIQSASEPSTKLLQSLHDDISTIPPVRPQNTPAACESRTMFEPLKLHKIYGCRQFRNQKHIIAASQNAKLLNTGDFPACLGSFTTINNPPAGKSRRARRKFLSKIHLDIVFGDCVSLGGYTHALLLVDDATRYSWIYGLASLTSANIIDALQHFHAHVGRLPTVFQTDFDTKLIGGATQRWILSNKSNIIATPANRHSSNGLVERTWRTIVTMARAYITEKKVSRNYWFYAVSHAASMLNQVPGRLGRRLTSPFELVHGTKPDAKTWFELFSIGYFKHDTDGSSKRAKCDAHTLDGIAVGRDDRSNTIVFYNPITKRYYRPAAFKLDESRLPITSFPKSISYEGGLTCGLLRNRTDPTPEPFPPGMRVLVQLQPDDEATQKGTIQNVPLPTDGDTTDTPTKYTIYLDDGKIVDVQFHQIIDPSTITPSHDATAYTNARISGLPHDLQPNSKITMDHNGAFHKGYLVHSPIHGFSFEYKRHPRATKPEWSVPLPNFIMTWSTLMADDLLFPGHSTVSSFLRPSSQNANTHQNVSANFVSATGLQLPCPTSLKFALDASNPDRLIWSQSYNEEKGGLENMDVFRRISKQEYLQLRKSGKVPKSIPSMCVIVVKYDKYGQPHRAKCRIVALGNFEDRYYSKSKRYAPVLKYSSLRLITSMAVADKCILQQGDCKQAFCNAILPSDEITVVRPPIGDPAYNDGEFWLLKKTLYGLRRSPRHWYDMMSSILTNMGLTASLHDPCLYSGYVTGSSKRTFQHPLHIGLYVDDFVFYTKDKTHEAAFKSELAKHIAIDWMGNVDFFLGTAFTWSQLDDGNLSVHLSQATFTEHLAHRFSVDSMNKTPNMTPYRSGLPIDSIQPSAPDDPDLARRRKVYQSIVGSINWLATNTRPDVAPALTFLASYMQLPSLQHYKSAIHVLKYLHSTSQYGISYHSNSTTTLQAYNHFPNHHDKEAYRDATPPSPSESMQLTAFSDACWGGQINNAVPDGTPIELFKLRSLSGFIICRSGGPIAWKSIRQNQTALSSCEAEVIATNECVTELLSVRHRCQDMSLPDVNNPTVVYNDNQACVDWSSAVTTKGIKHVNLRENRVREAHVDKHITVKHIPGVINSADIFTKELKDSAHFRRLRDSFMVSKANFHQFHHNVPDHMAPRSNLPYTSPSTCPSDDASIIRSSAHSTGGC